MHLLDAATTGLRRIVEPVVVAVYAASACVVIAQVVFRYLLNDSLVWAEEFLRYSLLWGVLLGAALVSLRREHVNVDFLREHLPPRGRRMLDVLNAALTVLFCALLTWFGIRFAQRATFAVSPAAGFPMAWVYAAMPIGGALMLCFTLASLRYTEGTEQDDENRLQGDGS